ncbi:MAG: lipoyl domain-containing protein [Gordonia sp. (in: high G+C Gram-positive bacteria)]|uniref:lipoyl domain-containing protein n=1 Tax=Gordonia TaxID=2053 RepID=UPI0032637D0A
MATEYPMPQWGITMEEGTISEWQVAVGDQVDEGTVLAQIATDKIDVDFESPAGGVIAALLAAEGDTVACGTSIVVIADDADAAAAYQA